MGVSEIGVIGGKGILRLGFRVSAFQKPINGGPKLSPFCKGILLFGGL